MIPNKRDLDEILAQLKDATPQEITYLEFRNPVFKEFMQIYKSKSPQYLWEHYDLISLKSMLPILWRLSYKDYID